MPSASPLYNYPGMTGDSDCPYRVPGPDDVRGNTRPSDAYDPFQCLNAMTEQNFPGTYHGPVQSCPPPQHYPPMHGQMTPYPSGAPVCVTSSSACHYYSSSSHAFCMYNSPSQQSHGQLRPPCDVTSTPPSEQNSPNKKNFPYPEEMYEGGEQETLLSWTRKHPEHWVNTEVLDWLFYSAQERGLDMHELRGEAFQNINGAQLCRMTSEDFLSLEPKYGKLFYEMFKKLLNGVLFTKPTEVNPTDCQDMTPFSPESCDASRDQPVPRSFGTPPSYHVLKKPEHPHNHPGQQMYPPPNGYWKTEPIPCDIDINSYDFDLNDPPMIQTNAGQPPSEYEMYQNGYHGPHGAMRPPCLYPGSAFAQQLPRRRPGRPRVKSLPDDQSRASKDKKVKNQHLWEFIYEALLNPLYNPQFLRWENQREGVFRFVQSEAVAQLWGTLKNNENMTYEKLSRAMRHYYKRGILERVEGRRLVYKFSRKAMDRVRDKRHNSI